MKVRLIVPNVNRNTTPVVAYGSCIANIAGGFTASQAIGGWKDDKGELIVEPVTVFDCILPRDWNEFMGCLASSSFQCLAAVIARELHQDCVYLEIDGTVEYIKG
jgi:hypothetical protein